MSFWQDEFGLWVHLTCGRRLRTLDPDTLSCPDCRTTAPAPWRQHAPAKLPAWYGGRGRAS